MRKKTEKIIKNTDYYCDICKEQAGNSTSWDQIYYCDKCGKDLCHKCFKELPIYFIADDLVKVLIHSENYHTTVCLECFDKYSNLELKATEKKYIKR